jgi:hypothetical protein
MKKLMLNSLCVFSLLAFASVGCSQDKAGSTTNSAAPAATNSAPAVSAAVSFDDPTKLTAQAPETFRAKFETTKGAFTVEITRSLSPNGADRFLQPRALGLFQVTSPFFASCPVSWCNSASTATRRYLGKMARCQHLR